MEHLFGNWKPYLFGSISKCRRWNVLRYTYTFHRNNKSQQLFYPVYKTINKPDRTDAYPTTSSSEIDPHVKVSPCDMKS